MYSSTKLGQNSKKKDNLGFVVTPSRHMASKRRKQCTACYFFPHYYHYVLLHGTLPLFDATKCRLCLRRLLRDFLSTLDVVLKCRSEVEQKRNGIANSFSPFFLSSSRAQFPHFVRWQGAFQIGLGCINNKRSNSFFFSESNREIPSPKQRPYSCKEATDLKPRL